MEHVDIKNLGKGFFKLTPDEDYLIKNKINNNLYSEAVTKKPQMFEAVIID